MVTNSKELPKKSVSMALPDMDFNPQIRVPSHPAIKLR
jgi:hypothetical protein